METKKLYRSKTNSMIAGVCGGLGEYFHVDPTLIRLFALFFIICTGLFPGVLAYIVAAIIIPKHP